MDIFHLDQVLIERYGVFARSFSDIRAPEKQVDAAYADQHIWHEPFITINPRFEAGASVDQLVAQGVLDPALDEIFAAGADRNPNKPSPPSRVRRDQSLQRRKLHCDHRHGPGKSLYFFLPIVDAVVRSRRAGGHWQIGQGYRITLEGEANAYL